MQLARDRFRLGKDGYAAVMRRLAILLIAVGLLAVHHAIPMAMEQREMAMGKGAMPASSAPMVLCIGMLAAAVVGLRRVGGYVAIRRRGDRPSVPWSLALSLEPSRARDRPPPNCPRLRSLCVNQR